MIPTELKAQRELVRKLAFEQTQVVAVMGMAEKYGIAQGTLTMLLTRLLEDRKKAETELDRLERALKFVLEVMGREPGQDAER